MKNNIMYYSKNDYIEYIYYNNSTKSYPMHTHANHVTLGYIMDGEVCIICNNDACLYHAGECYCIMPDILHAVEQVNDKTYSMVSICLDYDRFLADTAEKISYTKKLKQIILNSSENELLIDNMAQKLSVSKYHMIRQFKTLYGLTPHQFQIQCRVRKAQKLLAEGRTVTEVAYATGFCDQSHFDRCFNKIVRLTPSEYKQSVKTSD